VDTVDILTTLGRTLGFSFAAGLNLYATVAILGLASRYHWVTLPPQFQAFDNSWVIGVAVVMYLVEFLADKIPWVDSLWDAVHTVIRPIGGAVIAVVALGHASPTVETLVALLGGAVAASSHLTKAGTRAFVNTSPEDVLVVALGWVTLQHPIIALVIATVLLILIAFFARFLISSIRRLFGGQRTAAAGSP
jgi:hypothetical protein